MDHSLPLLRPPYVQVHFFFTWILSNEYDGASRPKKKRFFSSPNSPYVGALPYMWCKLSVHLLQIHRSTLKPFSFPFLKVRMCKNRFTRACMTGKELTPTIWYSHNLLWKNVLALCFHMRILGVFRNASFCSSRTHSMKTYTKIYTCHCMRHCAVFHAPSSLYAARPKTKSAPPPNSRPVEGGGALPPFGRASVGVGGGGIFLLWLRWQNGATLRAFLGHRTSNFQDFRTLRAQALPYIAKKPPEPLNGMF